MKAIQYREDGKFYGLVSVPDEPHEIMEGFGIDDIGWIKYNNELKACIAAGKEIINPEVLPMMLNQMDNLVMHPSDIFDCPDNIEFEEDQFCAYHNLNCSYCGTCAGSCYKPEKVIRLKLKEEDTHWGIHLKSIDIVPDIARIVNENFMELATTEVKPVESQDGAILELLSLYDELNKDHRSTSAIIDELKSKFTIQRNKNGNE